MANRDDRYAERMELQYGEEEISVNKYNMIIAGVLFYGFIVNCLMVNFCYDAAFTLASSGFVFYLVYFALVLIGSFLIHGSNNPVISFIGYNLIVVPLGLVLTVVINAYASAGYQSTITTAFAITAIVTLAMMAISSVIPNFFLSLGRTLFVTLLVTVVIELILAFLGAPLAIIDYIVVLLFCGYIGYDWAKANQCAKTVDNAIDCASDLYVDIINLFLRILRILSRANSR